MKNSHLLPLCFLLLWASCHAHAVDPSRQLSQYGHSVWRLQDGFLTGRANAIAQTKDGFLWIGTQDGLIRFDGVRFVPWAPMPGGKAPSFRVYSLRAARDGSLWIGGSDGLMHWDDHKLIKYPDSVGRVTAIIERRNGEIWFTRFLREDQDGGAICRVVGMQTQCYGQKQGIVLIGGGPLMEDPSGVLWSGDSTSLLRWSSTSSSVLRPTELRGNVAEGVMEIVSQADGALLAGICRPGRGLGLEQVVQGKLRPFRIPGLDGSSLTVTALLSDKEGSLWIGTEAEGIYRVHNGTVDHVHSIDGLSGDYIVTIFEDRSGDIWVATTKGIDCFRDLRVTSIPGIRGLGTDEIDSVVASHDGTVWAGGAEDLGSIRNGTISSLRSKKGLPGDQVTSLLEDDRGRLWVGIDDTLNIYENGRFRRIHRPDGSAFGFVVGLSEDTNHNVWAEISGSPRRLVRIKDDTVKDEFPAPQMPAARKVAASPDGSIWLGLLSGDLGRYANNKLDIFHFGHGELSNEQSYIRQLFVGSDGSVLGATSSGVIAWKDGRQQTMTVKNGLPCDDIQALITDDHGDLWLYAQCGLLDITQSELEEWWAKPDHKVQPRLLDALDGAQPGLAPFNGAAKSPDGRLWFASGSVLQTINPAEHVNESDPPVYVVDVVADRQNHEVANGLRLDPIKNELEIDYTAPSLATPQKIHFRYMLKGWETVWHDAGTRRQAFYDSLPPGKYTFQVMDSNTDGNWNSRAATLSFEVLPTWYQTHRFILACIAATMTMIWVLYRIRIGYIARDISTRFDERLAERTRMARELHDTFLQTIQGSKFVVDDGLEKPLDPEKMHRALGQVSGWLDQAIHEGRAALNSLRSSTTQTNELGPALRRAAESGIVPEGMAISFSIIGDANELHPIVRDELYRIAYEAIQNAKAHSHASTLSIDLNYGHDLLLRIRDNGVGIDPSYAIDGKEGHHGLQGMRERAAHIQGKLTILSSTCYGTDVSLVVPGSISFLHAKPGLLASLRKLYRRIFALQETP